MTGSTFRIGRKLDNDLQIVENSVSGEHAELRLDDEGAVIVDLGSTNGTRVGNDRILEMRIRPGARVRGSGATASSASSSFRNRGSACKAVLVTRGPR